MVRLVLPVIEPDYVCSSDCALTNIKIDLIDPSAMHKGTCLILSGQFESVPMNEGGARISVG